MSYIEIRTLHDPVGKRPEWPDYWLAWEGDGFTEKEAITDAKARMAAGAGADPAYRSV